jgi:hypothetical protein
MSKLMPWYHVHIRYPSRALAQNIGSVYKFRVSTAQFNKPFEPALGKGFVFVTNSHDLSHREIPAYSF